MRVIGEVAEAMVEMARSSARARWARAPSPIVLAGGLFRHPSGRLERAIAEARPRPRS